MEENKTRDILQVLHLKVLYRPPEEQFHLFFAIGEEESSKLIKSSKSTCILDPIPTKLLKEILPKVLNTLLNIINSSLSLGYVSKTFKLTVINISATTVMMFP